MIPIEKCLNCTQTECIGGMPECHVRGKRSALFDEERAKELYDTGISDSAIARELNVSQSSIGKWRRRNGLAANYKRGVKIAQKKEG